MKVIKGIGFNIPSEIDDQIRLDSKSSLSECDIVIYEPNMELTNYSNSTNTFGEDGYYQGKICYNHRSSEHMLEHINHWQSEIKSYLNTGKTLFVILPKRDSFFIQSGQTKRSGTGRNQKVINLVSEYDNHKFLPKIETIEYKEAHGKIVISPNPKFKNFTNEFKDFLTYEAHVSDHKNLEIGFTTKAKDKILGGIIPVLNGNVVYLPKIDFEREDFIEYDKNDKPYWNKKALIIGKKFSSSIIEIDKIIRKSIEKTPKPIWLQSSKYTSIKAKNIEKNIEKIEKEISKLNTELEKTKETLEEAQILTELLYETGKPLENAVIYALKLLGYKADNFTNGDLELDQVIVSPEGHRYIGECEGKDSKSIDISKFRQLTDSLSEDFERVEVEEKAYGILFGNPHRLTDPENRKEPFTKKCLNGAKRELIGLIETKELYYSCKYLEARKSNSFMKACRMAIFNSLGSKILLPKPPNKKTSA